MKKPIISLIFASLFLISLNAQNTATFISSDHSLENETIVAVVNKANSTAKTKKPESIFGKSSLTQFPGGMKALTRYLAKNTHYPEIAREYGFEGTVKVQFVILPDGDLSDVKVIQSVNNILDAAAIEVVSNMPRWEPAYQAGRPVKMRVNVPVEFRLK